MTKKSLLLCFILLTLLVLAGCSSTTETPVNTPTALSAGTETAVSPQTFEQIDCALATISSVTILGEKLTNSGNAPAHQNFSVDKDTNYRVYWTQSTKDNFDLSFVNQDPTIKDDVEKTTTLESFVGPSSGCVDAPLSAGNYQLVVENANGPWQVWVEEIEYK
jgi:uncharacterized protein YcfL